MRVAMQRHAQRRSPRFLLALTLALPLAVGALACKKDGEGTANPGNSKMHGTAKVEPEVAVPIIIQAMSEGDRAKLLQICDGDLKHDLSQAAFDDFATVIKYLGTMKDFYEEANEDTPVAKQRVYELEFDKGEVRLMVQLYPDGGLIGFHFDGDTFVAAEHGALEDGYSSFKVYDFKLLDGKGNEMDTLRTRKGEVRYQLIIGGLEAKKGEHHVSVEKIVFTDKKEEIYHQPQEFDLKFEENAEGIPRGVIRGSIEIHEKGHFDMEFKIRDNLAKEEIDYHADVEVF